MLNITFKRDSIQLCRSLRKNLALIYRLKLFGIFSSTYLIDNGKNKVIINNIIKPGVSLCLCLCVHEHAKVCLCLCVYAHEHRHIHLYIGHSETLFRRDFSLATFWGLGTKFKPSGLLQALLPALSSHWPMERKSLV